MTELPLKDVKILDLTHVWAGPLSVRLLSDLGAEVIKIEAHQSFLLPMKNRIFQAES